MSAAIQVCIFVYAFVEVVLGLPLLPRLTQAEWASYYDRDLKGPGTYAFGYDVEDSATGNVQFRHEEKHLNGSITGSYGLLEPDGNVRIVHYTADTEGFRAIIENSSGTTVHYPAIPAVGAAGESGPPAQQTPPYVPGNLPVRPQSPELASALESTNTLGQPVYEQHTPPKYTGNVQAYPNYPPFQQPNYQQFDRNRFNSFKANNADYNLLYY